MTLKSSLTVFVAGSVLAWVAWALIVTTVEPGPAGMVGEAFFFGALLLAMTGTLTTLGILGRARMFSKLPATYVGPAFRQGILISIALVGALLLQRLQFLFWWNLVLMGVILVMIDLVLSNRRRV